MLDQNLRIQEHLTYFFLKHRHIIINRLVIAISGKEKLHFTDRLSYFFVYSQNYISQREKMISRFFSLSCFFFHLESELCILCKMSCVTNPSRPHKHLTLTEKKQTLSVLMSLLQSSMYPSEFKCIKHLQ